MKHIQSIALLLALACVSCGQERKNPKDVRVPATVSNSVDCATVPKGWVCDSQHSSNPEEYQNAVNCHIDIQAMLRRRSS